MALLQGAWNHERDPQFRAVLLRALSASRQPAALEILFNLVRNGREVDATAAVEALALHRDSADIRRQAEESGGASGRGRAGSAAAVIRAGGECVRWGERSSKRVVPAHGFAIGSYRGRSDYTLSPENRLVCKTLHCAVDREFRWIAGQRSGRSGLPLHAVAPVVY